MLDPRRLLTFREVAQRRSFSLAAVALSLTQPAVSQQIRALEVELGERLIERDRTRGFALTPAGELLLVHAEALFERMQLAERQVTEAIAGVRRHLRIGAFPSVLATLVPNAIAELNGSRALEVSVVQGSTDELVGSVRTGDLHLALCFQDASAPRREHEGTRRIDLLEEPMVAMLGPRHRLANRRRIRLAELATDTWITPSRGGLIERACIAAGFEPRIAYLTSDPLAITRLVGADLAVGLTPRLLSGQLAAISTPALSGKPVKRTIYAVTPSAGAHPLAAPFLSALTATAATPAGGT
jgi:DNA-binding transcriptional LysR family regulator